MSEPLWEAVVILPGRGTKDRRRLVNIAAAQAKRKEKTKKDISIRTIQWIEEQDLKVYVAIYQSPHNVRSIGSRGHRESLP